MLILIDNYDSFTWNLVQYFGDLGQQVEVYRNDRISADDVIAKDPQAIVISPGPGTPDDSGICLDLIEKASNDCIPLLGICLGHQAIGQVYGGTITRGNAPVHGKVERITHDESGLFSWLPSPCPVTRYHSLIVAQERFPACLEITARSEDNVIMALQHKSKPVYGMQFHPESIATEYGHRLLQNFMNLTGVK